MLRMLQTQALHALNSWRGFVALRRRHKAVLRRTLGHLQNQAVASAFERWGELPKVKRRAARVLLRMVQSRAWSAFHSWTTWAVQQHRDAAVMLRAVRKIQHRFAAGASARGPATPNGRARRGGGWAGDRRARRRWLTREPRRSS